MDSAHVAQRTLYCISLIVYF